MVSPQGITEEEALAAQKADKPLFWLPFCLLPALVYCLCGAVAFGRSFTQMLTGLMQLAAFGLVFFFVLLLCDVKGSWLYDNDRHKYRFVIVFLAGLVIALVQAFVSLPVFWLMMPVAIALFLCSGTYQAVGGYMLLLLMTDQLAAMSAATFAAYAMIGIAGMLLFTFLDENFLFGLPLLCALLLQTLVLLGIAFAAEGRLTLQSLLFAAISLGVGFLLLTFCLKYLSSGVLHRESDIYDRINDPEFTLLVQLKEKNQRAYYHAIHTAHFCEKLAGLIGADVALCKAGGYYHKIGKMRGESNISHALDIAAEYDFPPQLRRLLKEYGAQNTPLRSKEAAIVLLSDAMVSSVMFLFEKNKNATLNYEQIAAVVFKQQLESHVLDDCVITMEELTTIRECFAGEKLYYDFLH
ncbi:MAG: HDIG domain-containing protein [Lachnospiraceae bacterium]|nr:HDIG domain-containing protein [Lachnospiraceae bacterium]